MWLEPYDLVLSLLLIMIVTVGGFRCIYQLFFESTFFSKHHCKVVLFFLYYFIISLLHHNFYNIFAMDLSNSCVMVSGSLNWCRQAGYQVFYMTHKYFHTNWYIHIVWTPPPSPLFKGRWEVNFNYHPCRGDLKQKKRGWKYGAGTGFLKKGGGREGAGFFLYLNFSRFIIFIFRNYFPLCKIVLCIWRKKFFCHHNSMKIGHSKLSKNEPENFP